MTWSEWLLSKVGARRPRRATEEVALLADLVRRADHPGLARRRDEGQIRVGWLVDWLHTEPFPRERLEPALRHESSGKDPLRRRTIAAAATFAGFDVPGGADEYIGRETSHRDIYGAQYHLPIIVYLEDADLPEARRIYAALGTTRPDDVRTPIGLSGLALRDGDRNGAIAHLERACVLAAALPEPGRDMRRQDWEPRLSDHLATLVGPDALAADEASEAAALVELAAAGALPALREHLQRRDGTRAAMRAKERAVCAAYGVLDPSGRRVLLTAAISVNLYWLPIPFPGDLALLAAARRDATKFFDPQRGWT